MPKPSPSPRVFASPLPIDAVLGDVVAHFAASHRAVLVAPPGAGKTTRLPLVLIEQEWARGQKIIVLEPRRIAARAAADRMAKTLGEKVGETIGLRVRAQTEVSKRTRLEVVTEGVFARMILDDPALTGVAMVIFDEFHERSLDADLSLALALDAASALREDLRLLVMSATLDGARVASLLDDAAVIVSEGRAFAVETRYLGRRPGERIEDAVAAAALRALAGERGSILAFLPGQGEILRTASILADKIRDSSVSVAPLYGALDRAAQDRAIQKIMPPQRKIVLATSIAETSLTIEGVRIVIDCGLTRAPRFEPDRGLTSLETVRVSRAAADQRRGRAGRTEPGVCYRLWEAPATGSLAPFAPPEIMAADLSGLVLDLSAWGARDPLSLRWLDPPPLPALKEARALLGEIGALQPDGALTDLGRTIQTFALPPRLARMIIIAAAQGFGALAAEVATLLVERGLGGDSPDLAQKLDRFRRDRSPRGEAARKLAQGFARKAGARWEMQDAGLCGACLALAFPDRIAKRRGALGEFLMASGRAAALEPHEALARENFLAIGEVAGRAGAARILAAAALGESELERAAGADIVTLEEVSFDPGSLSLRARRRRRLGALVLGEHNLPAPAGPESARALAEGLAACGGLGKLPFTRAQTQWRDRIAFLRRAAPGESWPDLSDAALARTAADWLGPFIEGRTSLSAITSDDLEQALGAMLAWDMRRRLDEEAPTHFETPAGSRIPLDYSSEGPPTLSVRVQELYGLSRHPALARGKIPLTLELLSPASRPIQVTADLPGFWRGSWAAVRTEMKGRYPRHLWPEDPARAEPTARAKPRTR
ncbi:ATP-dependent helicase HrpB [Methylocella silvestris]|uniref:ATP-dependent helicase HrpB n=1 Tax=Methylocella silvestris TaxID=199596 RepID=A0A2J7TGB8_METSI|nr:ATP-dependent helicase HrpB [Methylocella silvestris]PNG25822.1 ATP-dependent helicase HrpB [Methylocella silvestris]